jgi:tetratricopeptide (TPR) repeat protein
VGQKEYPENERAGYLSQKNEMNRSTSSCYLLLCTLLVLPSISGCLTVRERGDRSFEAKQYGQAAALYEEAIQAGDRDSQVYLMAARTALHLGDPGGAERNYSRAIRNGGGVGVARELADFYVRTSNYGSAVRVFRYLLNRVTDVQPIYNNLGTAMMYAGSPMDAESYLIVAQQMDPSDPFPYVNLGLLYDQYLNRPSAAVAFYRCFAQMSARNAKVRDVEQRIQEMGREFRGIGLYEIACGEVYRFDELRWVRPPKNAEFPSEAESKDGVREEIVLVESEDGSPDEASSPAVSATSEEQNINTLANEAASQLIERAVAKERAGDIEAALVLYGACYDTHQDQPSLYALIRLRSANGHVEEVYRLCEENKEQVAHDSEASRSCQAAVETK